MITGVGLVTSLGCSKGIFWNAIRAGLNGISKVEGLDTLPYGKYFGGQIKYPISWNGILSAHEEKLYGRASQFAIFAANEALLESGILSVPYFDSLRSRIGVIVGTTFGEAQILERINGNLLQNKTLEGRSCLKRELRQYSPNAISVNLAKKFGFCGPVFVVPTACAAGNYAIGMGATLIRHDKADVVICGGADSFSRVAFAGFSRLGVMGDEKCQPFDRYRKGMIVGEGAGMVVLEDRTLALKRTMRSCVEVLGIGLSCDAQHMTTPTVDGMTMAMERAIESGEISIRDVDYICAHGTGTVMNDKMESAAIRKLFYEHGRSVPVSSVKSTLGHTMGAASAIEAIACAIAIEEEEIPPTANFETPDPECNIDCVPNKARSKCLKVVLNNSFAFGGNNSCLVLGKV